MTIQNCPLCDKFEHMLDFMPHTLYDHAVCERCAKDFASRRRLAFIFDLIFFAFIAIAFGNGIGITYDADGNYFMAFHGVTLLLRDSIAGQSPGKYLLNLRVIDATTGKPCGIQQSIIRNSALLVPFVWIIAGFMLRKGPRPGDRWAHTRVVWKRHAHSPIFNPIAVSRTFE